MRESCVYFLNTTLLFYLILFGQRFSSYVWSVTNGATGSFLVATLLSGVKATVSLLKKLSKPHKEIIRTVGHVCFYHEMIEA